VTERKPSKDFKSRYDAAKQWRNGVERDIKDALKYCAPGREHDFDTPQSKHIPATEIFTSLAEELAGDLASDLVTYYTPPEVRWMDWKVTTPVQEDFADAVLALVNSREEQIFDLIESSNYYDVAPQVFFEMASHGTAAMWVDQAHIAQPVYVEPVPPNELLITPGHLGYLDRFREKSVLAEHLPIMFAGQDVDLTDLKIQDKIKKPGAKAKVCWGFWLDWSDQAYPVWMHEITVDGKRVTDEKQVLGPLAGACPLLVGRFNPRINYPWGRGPAIKALPEILTLDDVSEKVLDNLDAALAPSWTYPDDGLLDMRDGIERNTAYPARPGTADAVRKLDLAGELDYGWFSEERIADRLRAAFFQDGPRQRGDTPPSATQWLDEARRVQKRLGKPSAPTWTELIYPFVQRVEYIGVETGAMESTISHNGQKLQISPVSPLQKAQNQDKVLITRSNLELAINIAGEQVGQIIDLQGTFAKIVDASGDELIQFQKKEGNNGPPNPAA
jgi:hypothetical protein